MTSQPPLTGLKVLELGGLAPGPFCGALLANWGASVLRIDRPGPASGDLLTAHKSSIALDLKSPASVEVFLSLIPTADVLIDPFRPGVLEKLGLDPESVLLEKNPRLIVVRLTGFRRDGKYSQMAGHDINYLAASGVLSMLGEKGRPPMGPGNILADFAGGGHAAFTGVLLALLHRSTSDKGQIVNANMVDGVSFLGTYPRFLTKMPMWSGERGTNTLDGGAPYYGCYECKDDGKYMSVGALEPQFWAELLKGLGLKEEETTPGKLDRLDKRSWPYMKELFMKKFRTKTRKEWEKIFDGTDACCVPVLEHGEMEKEGYEQRPIVGLSESPGIKIESAWSAEPMKPGQGGEERLREWVGWTKGRDYEVTSKGTFEKKERSKL